MNMRWQRECGDLLAITRLGQRIMEAAGLEEIVETFVAFWDDVAELGYLAYFEVEEEGILLRGESSGKMLTMELDRREVARRENVFAALTAREVRLIDVATLRSELGGLSYPDNGSGQGRAALVKLRAERPGLLVLADFGASPTPLLRHAEALETLGTQLAAMLNMLEQRKCLEHSFETLQKAQKQLIHAEKFAAVGILSAEIAHEINNPASFVISNLSVMRDYVETIASCMSGIEELIHSKIPHNERVRRFEQITAEGELDFIQEDFQVLVSRSLSGMQRIHQIVRDLRHFANQEQQEPGWVEMEQLVGGALNLLRHEAKYRTRIQLELDDAPSVFTDANLLSQALLSVMVNAVQAIEPGKPEENELFVGAEAVDADQVCIIVRDTGRGIPETHREQIFEPFFTTKDPRSGTGLGLSISREILRSLGGEISVESEVGKGTTMRIVLPVRAARFAQVRRISESGSFQSLPRSDWEGDGAGDGGGAS